MDISFESQLEVYRSLSGQAKLIVDMLAHSCCPINRKDMESLFPDVTSPRSELHATFKRLQQAKIVWYCMEGGSTDDYYTSMLALELTILLFLQQVKEGRDIEQEVSTPQFWEKVNRTGRPTIERILAIFFDVKLPDHDHFPIPHFYKQQLLNTASKMKSSFHLETTFPEKYLIRHFRDIVRLQIEQIHPNPSIACWYDRFTVIHKNSPLFHATLQDTRAILTLLLPGKSDQIPDNVNPATREGASLLGMYYLYQGDYSRALRYFSEGESNKTIFDDYRPTQYPIFLFGKAMAYLLDSKTSIDINSPLNILPPDDIFERLAWANKMNKSPEEITRLLPAEGSLPPLSQYLLNSMKQYLGLAVDGSLTFLEHQAAKLGWDIPSLVNKCLSRKNLVSFKQNTILTGKWEKTFAPLVEQTFTPIIQKDRTKELLATRTNTFRIAYFIRTWGKQQWMIVPKLQKTKDGITWTSGMPIAAPRLFEGSVPDMTDWDCELAYPNLSKEDKIILLAGHPHVYNEKDEQRRSVQIIKINPAISIRQDDTGYCITTNLKNFVSRQKILWERNFLKATIYEITRQQHYILSWLDKFSHLPFEAHDALVALIKHLQKSVTIYTDIEINIE